MLAGLGLTDSNLSFTDQPFIYIKKDVGLNALGLSLLCHEHSNLLLLTGDPSLR